MIINNYLYRLEEDFLKYIDDWEGGVMGLKEVPYADRRKMCLSEETIEGLRIAGIYYKHVMHITYM